VSDLFYDRDRNISGISDLETIEYQPIFGSSVTFSTRANSLTYPNRVNRRMGQSLNSVIAEYDLSFQLNDANAQKLINYLESRSGVLPVSLSDSSSIYKPITGFADEFSWATKGNLENDISLKAVVDNRSPQLNWSGLAFVDNTFKIWKTGELVQPYEIRYFDYDGQNKFNNYFYCTGEHFSTYENGPFSSGSLWTQNLFLNESLDYSISSKPDVSKMEFNNSFYSRIKTKKNIHSIENLTLKFEGLSDVQTKAILHFAESKFGELKFQYQIPKIYNRPKVFYCPTWRHTWIFQNSNTVELDLVEDSLGILPKNNSPSVSFSQRDSTDHLEFSLESQNGATVIKSGDIQNVFSDGEIKINWQNSPQTVSIFGAPEKIEAHNQFLWSFNVAESSSLRELDLSSCNLETINFSNNKKLSYVDLSNNSLKELDLGLMKSLKSLNISNNRISSLDLTRCSGITGIKCGGNKISGASFSSALDALVNYENFSGEFLAADSNYVDFASNSPLPASSLNDFAVLGWRGWNLSFDNAKTPLDVSGYGKPVLYFNQDSLKDKQNGEHIFTWDDSIRNFDASRIVVSDSLKPEIIKDEFAGGRSALRFNGESCLAQVNSLNSPIHYSIFAVVKPASSGMMCVFSDYWNRGMYVSGNKLLSKTNMGSTQLGELSTGYNVVGIYTSGVVVSGSINSQTPITGAPRLGTSNIVLPGSIGLPRYGASGILSGQNGFVGEISEIALFTGDVNFGKVMRDLGAKHGLEIL